MIFTLQNYIHYIITNPFIFYIDHQVLKYLVNKPLQYGWICCWLLLFQEFEFEIIIRPGKATVGPDHLSGIEVGEELDEIDDDQLDVHLFWVKAVSP